MYLIREKFGRYNVSRMREMNCEQLRRNCKEKDPGSSSGIVTTGQLFSNKCSLMPTEIIIKEKIYLGGRQQNRQVNLSIF